MIGPLCLLALAYLFASIPFGLILSTLYGTGHDLRNAGSGNIGATNVARVFGWRLGLATLLLDMAKGFLPVLISSLLFGDVLPLLPALMVVVAFLAHCFPAYLEFRGGKGVATAAGGLLALSPLVALPAILLWLVLIKLTGKSSLAALGAAVAVVGFAYWLDPIVLPVTAGLALAIYGTHLTNIRRLVAGTEEQMVKPVRWSRTSAISDVERALAEGPAGSVPEPMWREE